MLSIYTQNMATLTETAYYTRRAINWTILGVIIYILMRISWAILVYIFLLLFPPKPPPPNHAFGILPKIQFPAQATPSAQLTFQLETIEGRVPVASDSAPVYFMPKSPANLLALTRTQAFARRLDLLPDPIAETKNIYIFNDAEQALRTLRYDIISNNFTLRYNYELDPFVFDEKNLPSEERARSDALGMLKNFALYTEDYRQGTNKITYLKLVGNQLINTASFSTADAIRVDFFRRPVGDMFVYNPNPDLGQIYFLYSGSGTNKKRLVEFRYIYHPIDYDTVGTYSLKKSQDAWSELAGGGGYIARYPSRGSRIIVRNVRLGYYDSFEPQMYLQPIFVFEGDDGFLGFVPAVATQWSE